MQLEAFFFNKLFYLINTQKKFPQNFLQKNYLTYFFYFEPIQRYNNKLFLKYFKKTNFIIYNTELKYLLKNLYLLLYKFLNNGIHVAFLFNSVNFSETLNYIFLPRTTYIYCRLNNFFNLQLLIQKNKLKQFLFFKNFFKINIIFYFLFNVNRTNLKFIKSQSTYTIGITSLNSKQEIFSYSFPIIVNYNFTMLFIKNLIFDLYLFNNLLK